jgi:hypothetical protein
MTHREPNQTPRFVALTYPLLMGTLFAAPVGIIGYGAWWAGSAVAVLAERVFA